MTGNAIGGKAEGIEKDTDWVLTDSFLASRKAPIVAFGLKATGNFSRIHGHLVGFYTPRLFRRRRMRRLKPMVHDLVALRSFWRWLRDS